MPIKPDVAKLVKEFEANQPEAAGKARLTSGSRTPDGQLQIILAPKRRKNYLRIKTRFKKAFKRKDLPLYKELTADEKKWWISEILKQAGKPTGFAHVGGNAQDISVKTLSLPQKRALKATLESKFGVYLEFVSQSKSEYNVPITRANVFHVYRQNAATKRQQGPITGSVGKRGANLSKDINTVQKLLRRFELPPLRPVKVTGKVDPHMIAYIEHFQRAILGMNRPDGRVDPRGRTIRRLVKGR